ncbi:hypothetical protein [Maridesulfovibrio ferrireducens]|uniref:hypothetical protein n=1 Tax=Maridesulfovibrio ferrireducens TaxID=246191 RepID=UPI001A22B78C|nr:hypothetical protein [Maridesulfovibrio ferrireducens]MBI9110298.1 hypothetical protein [Maridesulfovibrio ferrireducens]
MKVLMNDLNPGTKFYFNENKPKDGCIYLRRLDSEEGKRINKACTTKKIEYKKGQRFAFEEFDDSKFDLLFYDYVIVSWEGLEDEDGTPIPCTAKNKKTLAMKSLVFQKILADAMDKLEEAHIEQEEATEKN